MNTLTKLLVACTILAALVLNGVKSEYVEAGILDHGPSVGVKIMKALITSIEITARGVEKSVRK